jgi:hypothetical protein
MGHGKPEAAGLSERNGELKVSGPSGREARERTQQKGVRE